MFSSVFCVCPCMSVFVSVCLLPVSLSFWKIPPEIGVQLTEAHHKLGLKRAGCQIFSEDAPFFHVIWYPPSALPASPPCSVLTPGFILHFTFREHSWKLLLSLASINHLPSKSHLSIVEQLNFP